MDDAAQVRRIVGYWRQVELFGGTVPDPPPLDPVRHCQDLLGGTLTINVDSLLEVNGFRTEEHWTLVYQPRLRRDDGYQAWYDDGRGGWTVSGSYLREDLRPGAQCQVMIEKTYSGSGTLFTTFHGQLDPDTDEGKGIAELTQFFPEYDGNLGVAPEFDGEVVGNETRTTYNASDGECVSSTEDVGHWFSPSWGTTAAPGAIAETAEGRGAQFAYTFDPRRLRRGEDRHLRGHAGGLTAADAGMRQGQLRRRAGRARPPPLRLPTAPMVRLVRDRTASTPLLGIERAHIELYIRHLGEAGLMASSINTMMHGVRGYFRFAHIDGVTPPTPRSTPDYLKSTATSRAPKASTGSSSSASSKSHRRSPSTTARWPTSSASTRSEHQKPPRSGSRTTPRLCAATACSTSSAKATSRPRCRSPSQSCACSKPAEANGPSGPLILRPLTGNPIDRRDVYRMVQRIARAAAIPRHISPHSLRHAAITNALDAGVPLRDAQILARHADPRTTEHYDRARGNLDRHGVHFLTAYVAGV